MKKNTIYPIKYQNPIFGWADDISQKASNAEMEEVLGTGKLHQPLKENTTIDSPFAPVGSFQAAQITTNVTVKTRTVKCQKVEASSSVLQWKNPVYIHQNKL